MRKADKVQLQELLVLLEQAQKEIWATAQAGHREEAAGLLGQCQEAAIRIGEQIEASEGEGSAAVRLLEDYCEAVFQIYGTLYGTADEEKDKSGDLDRIAQSRSRQLLPDVDGSVGALTALLDQIKDHVEKEIKIRTEAVFLPYKASMWDSLESVWKAADEDPDCDAYVIPIPYYDKNPDGSFAEEHYEGGLYPAYVPITRYQDYDFAARRPDMIFIHNPYDEHNLVTSVHPFFYSKNLKQYTEKLVYIPYFILNEIDPANREAVKGIEHLCVVSAVIYADKVIVQSEAMRQIYIDLMMENMQTDKIPRSYWEKKILGLGSPKLDKVQKTRKEDIKIPEEWLKVIQKEDGSWKKIVFYNTSVGAMIKYEEKMIAKMRDVFRVFREKQDEVALLWRPHPLMEATIRSLRPELRDEYERLVGEYRELGWGIYDDTADVDRAVVLCDGYYGDESSIVQLYERTKKLMIQNVEHTSYEYHKRLRVIDFIDVGDSIWFCAFLTRGLFRFDKASRKTKLVCTLPSKTSSETYRALYLKNGKLYLAPVYAENIEVFDISMEKLMSIPLRSDPDKYRRMPSQSTADFINIYEYDKYLFFIPLSYGAIVRLDTENEKVDHYNEFAELLWPIVRDRDAFWFKQSCMIDGKIYMPSSCANAMIEFDMETCSTFLYKIGGEDIGFSGICYDGKRFWILNRIGDRMIIWDKDKGIIDRIQVKKRGRYNSFFFFRKGIMRVPCKGRLICDRIDPISYDMITVDLELEENKRSGISNAFEENSAAFCAKISGDILSVYSTRRDALCLFDETGNCLQEYIFEVSPEDHRDYIQMQKERLECLIKEKKDHVFFEDGIGIDLTCYIEYLISDTFGGCGGGSNGKNIAFS